MTQNQHARPADLTTARITRGQIDRGIAEGRRLQGLAVRRAFGRLLQGIRALGSRGLFPVRIRHRLGGDRASACC